MPPRPFCLLLLAIALAGDCSQLVRADEPRLRGPQKVVIAAQRPTWNHRFLAHGLGRPVADAETIVQMPSPGKYRIWVRTHDWVSQGTQGRVDAPGKFQVLSNDKPL